MMTFLPSFNLLQLPKLLDYRRLGKQRVEAKQILETLDHGGSWANHPAVRMWAGFEELLKVYFNVIVHEWISRGYKNNLPLYYVDIKNVKFPWWWGWKQMEFSHQAALNRKAPNYYSFNVPTKYMSYTYVWPPGTKGFRQLTPTDYNLDISQLAELI